MLLYGTFLSECIIQGGGNVSTELQSLTGFFHLMLMDYASIPNGIPKKIRHLEQ